MPDPFSHKTDQEIHHEMVALQQALKSRADYRRKPGESPMDETGNGLGLGGGSLRLPGGAGASWRGVAGLGGIVVLALVASLGVLLYINDNGFKALEAREVERVKVIKETAGAQADQTKRMSDEHKEIVDAVDTLIYAVTLPEAEKAKLRLKMPRRLQEMERERR
jgi:hypothetical protein